MKIQDSAVGKEQQPNAGTDKSHLVRPTLGKKSIRGRPRGDPALDWAPGEGLVEVQARIFLTTEEGWVKENVARMILPLLTKDAALGGTRRRHK